MIHYTCDRCKRTIDPATEARYIVEIDVRLAGAIETVANEDDDVDQLSELNEQLERELSADIEPLLDSEPIAATIRDDFEEGPEQYDLCEHCYESFSVNPLGKETTVGFGFSNN